MQFEPIGKTSTGGDGGGWGFADEDEEDTETDKDTGNPWLKALEIWTTFIKINTTDPVIMSESEEPEA